MLFPDYKPQELEPQIVEYWREKKVLDKLRKKNEKGPKFYFLDGPPYTSGRFHLAHAWNYGLKDMVLRYKRMQGFNLWDRNGFDMHGLPTEHKVMAKYKLETKKDIEKFGLAKFIAECEAFSKEMAALMTKDLERMGITFDLKNPYMPITPEFMEGEWGLIKTAQEQKRLYYGEKVLTWCQFCETSIAKHECEYETVKDNSIFVKFQLKKKKDEFFVVWTTTPWTIPFNLAVMVHPEIDYVKVQVDGEKWILAKALAALVVQSVAGKKMKVLEEFKGSRLEGLEYVHPWEKEIPFAELKKKHKNIHTVILNSQYVDTTAGTGLVHAAPGCGPEDQEACKPYDIPPFNLVQENGFFAPEIGQFAGKRAKVNDAEFIEALRKTGALVGESVVEHEYPHCWRCHQPVIFRITNQWFFRVEDLREKMLKGNKGVQWIPDTALHSYESWITSLKDNSISRQRYWGTPLPIWRCEKCDAVEVIGSRAELKKKGGKVPKNLHLPWIDKVVLKCSCSGMMRRVPDVIDVWVDSGTASWNSLDNNPALMKKWFPADAILEAKEQTRLWFSMLSICSYLYLGKPAYKNVYVYGMLNDIEGRKMSKSLGNIISPYELIDKHGVDVLRYYMGQNDAGKEINFSWDECIVKARNLQVLWNVHKFLISLAQENKVNPSKLDASINFNVMGVEEKYIVSRLHSTMKKVTGLYENYRLDEAIAPLEEVYLELSRTYIQMVREKSSAGEDEDKEVVMFTIGYVLLELLKMFQIVTPFVCEAIYLNLKEEFGLKELSLSHYRWPKFEAKRIDVKLEGAMNVTQDIIQAALNAREKAKLGLRWPVKEVVIVTRNAETVEAVEQLREIIQSQVNAKAISVLETMPGMKLKVKPNYAKLGPAFAEFSPQVIAHLTMTSPETILKRIEEQNKYTAKVDGREITITKEMLTIDREVPAVYVGGESKQALVYINTERTEELETEGFAREVMRQVQQLRKEAGLQKLDRVLLYLKVSEEMKKRLGKFKLDIEEKVGAERSEISTLDPVRKHLYQKEFAVKGEKFKVWMGKV
ncbi:isoleucine--tRNA ligase [Candidatus Woesearchaeota archaeon]|nr:isoleucine--tRNA ligase [Candidatus Woesearchaeota archaeon]